MARFASLAALLFVVACAASPPPKLYLFDEPEPSATALARVGSSIGLRELSLPLYARRPQVASLEADGSIAASDDHRWGEEPPRAATRVVARALERSGGGEVFVEPWPIGAAPDLVVSVEVDRVIGALGGEATLRGEVSIARRDARGDARKTAFDIRVAAEGPDHRALTRAYAAAYARLAEEIARAAASF